MCAVEGEPELKEKTFDAGDVRINYAVGPPFIFLHGVTLRWQNFRDILPAFVEAYQVYSVDLRGHGLSGHVPNGYRLLDYAQDLLHFLRSEVIEPAVVFGHSLGALVAIGIAAQAPVSVRALILEDPPLH